MEGKPVIQQNIIADGYRHGGSYFLPGAHQSPFQGIVRRAKHQGSDNQPTDEDTAHNQDIKFIIQPLLFFHTRSILPYYCLINNLIVI